MRIVCPSCQAIYDVPDALLAPLAGQRKAAKLRCARCAAEWTPDRPEAPPQPPIPPPVEKPVGPTPSPFTDALAQAIPARPAPSPPATPVVAPPSAAVPPPAAALRPPVIDPTPPPAAGEPLVADEHLGPARFPSRAPPPARTPRDSATLLFAWSLSIGVLAALLVAAYIHRTEVIAFWPPAARAYDLLGLK